MFRKMRRFKQQITDEQCIEVLMNAKRGVLSLIGEDGYPYGLPINQWYCEEDGKLYFHGAKEGHKIETITLLPKYEEEDEAEESPVVVEEAQPKDESDDIF